MAYMPWYGAVHTMCTSTGTSSLEVPVYETSLQCSMVTVWSTGRFFFCLRRSIAMSVNVGAKRWTEMLDCMLWTATHGVTQIRSRNALSRSGDAEWHLINHHYFETFFMKLWTWTVPCWSIMHSTSKDVRCAISSRCRFEFHRILSSNIIWYFESIQTKAFSISVSDISRSVECKAPGTSSQIDDSVHQHFRLLLLTMTYERSDKRWLSLFSVCRVNNCWWKDSSKVWHLS